jgi:hypothetical protein
MFRDSRACLDPHPLHTRLQFFISSAFTYPVLPCYYHFIQTPPLTPMKVATLVLLGIAVTLQWLKRLS